MRTVRQLAFGVLLLFGTTVCSQDRPHLLTFEIHEVPTVVETAAFPAKCGRDDAVYVRFVTGRLLPPSKIAADGSKVTTFGLGGTRYADHARIWDFAPTPEGGIYEIIFYRLNDSEQGYRLLSFDKDGKLESDAALNLPFDPQHIAVLGNGTLVVEGRRTTRLGGHTGNPGMAIVDQRGQLIKGLKREGDLQKPSAKSAAKPSPEDELADEQFNNSIDLSSAQSADDGNVYVLRKSPNGPLFAISPDGNVRTLSLPKFENAVINTAMVTKGHLMIHYVTSERTEGGYRNRDLGFYSVYDLETLEKIVEYSLGDPNNPIRNSMPACYSLNQISFLRINQNHHPVLHVAKPR